MPAITLQAGGYKFSATIEEVGENWELAFRYSKPLIAEVKAMEGARWNPNQRTWAVKRSNRNRFTLAFLMGKPVFEPYERPLLQVTPNRPMPCGHGMHPKKPCPVCGCKFCLGEHQVTMIAHALTRRRSIIAGKPGTGKTLVYIEALELTEGEFGLSDVPYYVSTEAGLLTCRSELVLHRSLVHPRMLTYDGLKRVLSTWREGDPPPRRLILDESQKCKGHKTQRSEAALYLADQMESYWKGKELLIEGTGTPDPNEPVDWWMQAEIARPGYLRESSWYAERKRLACIEERQGMSGYYPHLLQWKDGLECVKCKERRELREAQLKEIEAVRAELEVMHAEALRAGVQMSEEKKEEVRRLISSNKRGQLEELMVGSLEDEACGFCGGTGRVPDEVGLLSKRLDGLVLSVSKPKDLPEKQYRTIEIEPQPDLLRAAEIVALTATNALDALNQCRQLSDGFLYDKDTHVPRYAGDGKMAVIRSLLEEYEDQRRLIIYAAYTASINKLKEECEKAGWLVWKYDGKSMEAWGGRTLDEAYEAFQDVRRFPDKIVYVAHPQKGGVSLTLTAAVAAVFYSNDFQGECREQAEDRIHRIGMDVNKGATIIDLLHLGTDKLVLDNLLEKREMSGLTIKHIRDALRR